MQARHWIIGLLLAAAAGAAQAGTRLTGDRVDGVPVAAAIDAAALPPGVHRFWYRVADDGIGGGWRVPVVVVRGFRPGPRLLVTAGIHGDELNGIDVAHRLIETTVPAKLSGTLTVVPGINAPALIASTRNLPLWGRLEGPNLNRSIVASGAETTGERYMQGLWNDVLRPNADRAVDLHTQSRGRDYTLYAFADPRLAGVRRLAELLNPDSIKLDPGVKGSIETSFVAAGVPAVTFELAAPERFQPEVIARAVAGLQNVMADLGMIDGKAVIRPAFVGTKNHEVILERGGWVRALVRTGDRVAAGQKVAEQRDAFGRIVRTYVTPVAGQVSSTSTTPVGLAGTSAVRILYASDDPKCRDGC